MRPDFVTHDQLEVLVKRMARLEDEVKQLRNNTAPTIPIYDSTDWPDDAIEGQIVIAPSA